MNSIVIAVHGGAGTILKSMLTPELELRYLGGLQQALDRGYKIIASGGTALDAVEQAVIALEDFELFNAGKGAVFTNDGIHELDASIMDGATLEAGAVSGVQGVKNPIRLAKEIMLHSEHVMLTGQGAQDFARKQELDMVPMEYYFNQYRYDQWQEAKAADTVQLDHSEAKEKKFGTVGAVALDQYGNLAAATSTGGMTNKKYGRIGDSAILGAGNYANNRTCAVSCTGHGEYFIRAVVAYDVSCLMEYKGMSLQQACETVVKDKLVTLGGEGGLIAVDALGNYELCFNSEGMYRGVKNNSGINTTAIYGS